MSQYPLRIPDSLMRAAKKTAKNDKTSLNQFIVMAIAEKVAALETEKLLVERSVLADKESFDDLLERIGK